VGWWETLTGTVEQWFGFGGNEDIAIGNDGLGNLVFRDEVVPGTPTLTELLEGADDDQVKVLVEDGETFRVKPDHQHIVFDTFTVEGTGVYIVEGQSVIFGGRSPQIFDGVDGAGGTAITGWTDVPINIVSLTTGTYSHSTPSAEVTVLRRGLYKVTAECSTTISSGTGRTDSEMRLMVDSGSGFTEVAGTRRAMYNRTLNLGENSASTSRYLQLDAGDKVKIQARKEGGPSNLQLLTNGSALNIERIGRANG